MNRLEKLVGIHETFTCVRGKCQTNAKRPVGHSVLT